MGLVRGVLLLIRGAFRNRAELAAENLALRQQLAALQHKSKCPRLWKQDRIFWAVLSRIWSNWRSALLIVQPDTVDGKGARMHAESRRFVSTVDHGIQSVAAARLATVLN